MNRLTVKEKKDLWADIQNDVRDDFLDVVTQAELAALAPAMKLNVPGFTRNYKRAPMGLLKRAFEHDFSRIRDMEKFLIKFAQTTYDELIDVPYEEGIKQITANHQLSKADTVALLGVLYSEHYQDIRQAFNKDGEGALLADIVEVSKADIAEALLQNHQSDLDNFLEHELFKEKEFNEDLSLTEFLQDYNIGKQFVTRSLYDESLKEEITEEERPILMELSNRELMYLQVMTWKFVDELMEDQEATAKEIERLKGMIDKQAAAIEEGKLAIEEQMTENQVLADRYQAEKLVLQEELAEEAAQFAAELSKHQSLFHEYDDIVLFTNRAEGFIQYLTEDKLFEMEGLENYVKGNNTDRNLFVDAYGLSTAEKLNIEKLCKQYEVKIPIINGDMTKLIRTIIFHLEGVSLV